MTKVTTLAVSVSENKEQKNGKPIEIINRVSCNGHIAAIKYKPSDYDYICLLCDGRNNGNDYDIIMAWDENFKENEKAILLGHWNDGFVEQ